MSMRLYMHHALQDETMGELNPQLARLGYFQDAQGNTYYPGGLIMTGPGVNALSRPLTTRSPIPINVNSPQQLVTLPNGQQFTPEQYQALLAQQGQQQSGNLLSGGVNSGGLQIGSTNISWPLIMIGILGVVLLQSAPVSRGGK